MKTKSLRLFYAYVEKGKNRVVDGHRNMTEIGHAFFRLYDCGLWLTMVIKSLKKLPIVSVDI